jgi:hypothetical protein
MRLLTERAPKTFAPLTACQRTDAEDRVWPKKFARLIAVPAFIARPHGRYCLGMFVAFTSSRLVAMSSLKN